MDLKQAPPWVMARALDLNRADEAQTSPLTPDRLAALVGWADFAPAVVEGDRVLAFLLGYGPAAGYDGQNFRWFQARYARFAYVDRVIVDPAARGRGLARRLYRDLDALGLGPLACEIYTTPPNPVSDAFHAALGFHEVGRAHMGPDRAVRYLIRR